MYIYVICIGKIYLGVGELGGLFYLRDNIFLLML